MKSLRTFKVLFHILALISGALICIIFVAFDISQLGIDFTLEHIREIFTTQYIYSFTFFFFPILFFALNSLLFKVLENNKSLAYQKQFSNNILSNINQSIVVCDHELNITYSNQLFLDEFEDLSIESIIQDDSTINSMKAGVEYYFKEIQFERNGKLKFYEVNFLDFEDINRVKQKQSILTFLDITQRKKNIKMIQEKDAILKSSAHLTSLGEMAAGMAHEINNPLAIISANNYILGKITNHQEIDKVKINKILNDNTKTIDRISLIIKSLRSLTRKSDSEAFISMPLNESISEALVLAKIKTNNTYIKFSSELKSIENEIVDIRKIQFAQTLVNLINNAIDAVKDQKNDEGVHVGWVKLELDTDMQNVFIRITDSGSGIPKHLTEKIFEPLYTTKPVGEGTGLGLSLSRRVVEEHSGELYLNHSCEQTQFVIKMPKSKYSNVA